MTRPIYRSQKRPGHIVMNGKGFSQVTDQGYVPYVPSKHKVEGRS